MKKYLMVSGTAVLLILSACSNEEGEPSEETEPESLSEDATTENDSDDSAQLKEENEELENRVNELENQNETLESQVADLEDELAAYDQENTDESSESSEDEEVSNETSEESSGEGTRTNPLSVGDTKNIQVRALTDDYEEVTGSAELTINNIVRGDEAYNALMNENQFNEPAPEGFEWVLINMTYHLTEMEDENMPVFVSDNIQIITDDGSSIENESAVTPDEFPWTEIYSGGKAEGNVSKLAPVGEPFLIKFDDYDNTVFFEVEATS
jgi:hypothetical protein